MAAKDEKEKWKFSRRELRAILLLLPFVAVATWILFAVGRPRTDASAVLLGDALADAATPTSNAPTLNAPAGDEPDAPLFDFDPNTVTYEELRALGIAKGTAAGIVKYRERGKVFQIPEDFATCYGISDSMYAALKPYIRIAPEYAPRKTFPARDYPATPERRTAKPEAALPDKFDPNAYAAKDFERLGFSAKQAAVIVNYRDSRGGFGSAEDFAACYVVSDEMYARLRDRMEIAVPEKVAATRPGKVDINTADSLTLVSVRGIGPKTASAIIARRTRLGGFSDIVQLAELKEVNEGNFELMRERIFADTCRIQKIDINFATPNAVGNHPYLSGKVLRRVLKNRQLKGGWSTIEEMVEDNTLTPGEAEKLAPYLHFTTTEK